MVYSLPGFSVHGFPRQEDWRTLLFPSPGIEPVSPALTGKFFTSEPPGKPLAYICAIQITYLLNTAIFFHLFILVGGSLLYSIVVVFAIH